MAPAATAEERTFSSRLLNRQGRKKNGMLRMQSPPESSLQSRGRAGNKSPSPVFADFLSSQITSVSMEGDWEGSSTKASDPSGAKAPSYMEKPYFFILEICEKTFLQGMKII